MHMYVYVAWMWHRQIGNSVETDNFSAMYPSNSYSWNYKLF